MQNICLLFSNKALWSQYSHALLASDMTSVPDLQGPSWKEWQTGRLGHEGEKASGESCCVIALLATATGGPLVLAGQGLILEEERKRLPSLYVLPPPQGLKLGGLKTKELTAILDAVTEVKAQGCY